MRAPPLSSLHNVACHSPVGPDCGPDAGDVVGSANEVLVLVPVVALGHDLLPLPALRLLVSGERRGLLVLRQFSDRSMWVDLAPGDYSLFIQIWSFPTLLPT